MNADILAYYKNTLQSHEDDATAVGWKNRAAQTVRFEQLLRIADAGAPFTLNDLGCGTGALLAYARDRYPMTGYTGYDLLPEMVALAKEQLQGDEEAFVLIGNAAEMQPADYTVASGIFSLRYSTAPAVWDAYIRSTLAEMHHHSTKGFAFNMLTTYSDAEHMQPHLHYGAPGAMFDLCKQQFSKNVALLHDYNEYDFTILVRK